MSIKKIGVIGLGNVGEAVVSSFKKYSYLIKNRTSLEIQIKKICDFNKSKQKFAKQIGIPFTNDPFELINDPEIDTIVELIGGLDPAFTFLVESLKNNKNIVTANKALLATKGKQIFAIARKYKKSVGFEASVCGAIPLIKSISEGLVSCEVNKIYGILNGTTNYILHKMDSENIDFQSALAEAQCKGLAESKPKLDIEGIDALHKLCILSYLCYGIWPSLKNVYAEGISRISLLDIVYAKELNYRIKLLAIAKKQKGSIDLRVHPTLLRIDHPLSQVTSAFNGVYLDTKPAGELFFYGEGAGGVPTSSAVISDIVDIASGRRKVIREEEDVPIQNIKNIKARYYIRVMAHDNPGVLAQVSKILSFFNISIASVKQKERGYGRYVPVIMITHQAKEDSVRKALVKINSLESIKNPSQLIRIEDL